MSKKLPLSCSRGHASIIIFRVMKMLAKASGGISPSEIKRRLHEDIKSGKLNKDFADLGLDREYALYISPNGTSRATRYKSFGTIRCVKAGYLIKNKKEKKWSITDAGLKAIKKGRDEFFEDADSKYKLWIKNNKKKP